MYYYTKSAFGAYQKSSGPQFWDPVTVLDLIHPLRGDIRGRRCMNLVASSGFGKSILDALSKEQNASEAAESPKMDSAASSTLCWQHKNQQRQVVREWASLLRSWAARNDDAKIKSEYSDYFATDSELDDDNCDSDNDDVSDTNDDSDSDDDGRNDRMRDLNEKLEKLRNLMDEVIVQMEEERKPKGKGQARGTRGSDRVKGEHQSQDTERLRCKEKNKAQKKREQEEAEKERKRQREQEEAERERQRREHEQEQAKRERERRERDEAIRQRAQLKREKRGREAREKAEREAMEWADSWDRYRKGWDEVMESESKKNLAAKSIPWPVKSGLLKDVTEAEVRMFFKKAPPEKQRNTAERRFKLANAENIQWHTDKMMQRFGKKTVDGKLKEPLSTIAKVVVETRQEAQKERRR